jgi:hypothetical protein
MRACVCLGLQRSDLIDTKVVVRGIMPVVANQNDIVVSNPASSEVVSPSDPGLVAYNDGSMRYLTAPNTISSSALHQHKTHHSH